MTYAHVPKHERRERAIRLLERVGLGARTEHMPNEMSGGQRQRVAIARALANDPPLILADEPTGALDSRSADSLLKLFEEINRSGQTILMVTHSIKAASSAGRVLFIKDGEVFHQIYRGSHTQEELYQQISDTLTLIATGASVGSSANFIHGEGGALYE